MSSKTKGIAFEKLTMNENKRDKEANFAVAFIQAIFAVGILYVIANLVLGWD